MYPRAFVSAVMRATMATSQKSTFEIVGRSVTRAVRVERAMKG